MKLEFAEVRLTQEGWDEAFELISSHKKEVIPEEFYYCLDMETHLKLAELGLLKVFVAMEAQTLRLVGYCIYVLCNKGGVDEIMAQHSGIFLAKEARKWTSAMQFLRFCEQKLKESGVHWTTQITTTKLDLSKFFKRAGYVAKEIVYAKRLLPL